MGAKATFQNNTSILRSELIIFQSLDLCDIGKTKNRKILETYLQPELPVSVDDCHTVFTLTPDKKHYLAFAVLKTDLQKELDAIEAQDGSTPEILVPEQYQLYLAYLSIPNAKRNAIILSSQRSNSSLIFIKDGNLIASYSLPKDDISALIRTIKLTTIQSHITPDELLICGDTQVSEEQFSFPVRHLSLPNVRISQKLNLRYGEFEHPKAKQRRKHIYLALSLLLFIISQIVFSSALTNYSHEKRLYEIADSSLKSQAELVANARFNSNGIIAALRAKGMTEWQNDALVALSTPDFSSELKDALEFALIRKITFSKITSSKQAITFVGKAISKNDIESWRTIATSKGLTFQEETIPSENATSFTIVITRKEEEQ